MEKIKQQVSDLAHNLVTIVMLTEDRLHITGIGKLEIVLTEYSR